MSTFSRHRYMIPKRCVEWKSENEHATRVQYSEIHVVVKGPKGIWSITDHLLPPFPKYFRSFH